MLKLITRATLCIARVFAVVRCLSVFLSVCLSVTRRYCVQTAKPIWKRFDHLVAPSFLFFFAQKPKSKGNLVNGGAKYTGWGNIVIFDSNHRLSRKWYQMDLWLLWTLIGSHRWRIDTCRFRWPWVTPKPGFKVTVKLQVELKNLGSYYTECANKNNPLEKNSISTEL